MLTIQDYRTQIIDNLAVMFQAINNPRFVVGYIEGENREIWRLTLTSRTKIVKLPGGIDMETFGISPEDAYHEMLKMTASEVIKRFNRG